MVAIILLTSPILDQHIDPNASRNIVSVQQGLRTAAATTTSLQELDVCRPTPNHTVIDVEDLELSCEQFRLENKPSLEDVFAYLGSEQLQIATSLKQQIVEWSLPELRVDLGSGTSADKDGILPTDMPVVDILNQTKLAALFTEGSVAALRASHVFEHFTYPQALIAFQNIRCLLDHDVGYARIATPDAKHPGAEYHEHKLKADWPSGIFKASYRDDIYPGHRALWSEAKMAVAASFAGLNARPLEWWSSDETKFCEQPHDGSNGFSIGRSAHRDKRNREKPLTYTSLIMDVSPQTLNDWKASTT